MHNKQRTLIHLLIKPVRKCSLTAELECQQWYRRWPSVDPVETALDPACVDLSVDGIVQQCIQTINIFTEVTAVFFYIYTKTICPLSVWVIAMFRYPTGIMSIQNISML